MHNLLTTYLARFMRRRYLLNPDLPDRIPRVLHALPGADAVVLGRDAHAAAPAADDQVPGAVGPVELHAADDGPVHARRVRDVAHLAARQRPADRLPGPVGLQVHAPERQVLHELPAQDRQAPESRRVLQGVVDGGQVRLVQHLVEGVRVLAEVCVAGGGDTLVVFFLLLPLGGGVEVAPVYLVDFMSWSIAWSRAGYIDTDVRGARNTVFGFLFICSLERICVF